MSVAAFVIQLPVVYVGKLPENVCKHLFWYIEFRFCHNGANVVFPVFALAKFCALLEARMSPILEGREPACFSGSQFALHGHSKKL